MFAFDSPDPHFERKVRSIRSPEEMEGFREELSRQQRHEGRRVTTDEFLLVKERAAALARGRG